MTDRLVHRIAAALLDYPGPDLLRSLPELRAAVGSLPAKRRADLEPLLQRLEDTDLAELQTSYVVLFDLARQRSLYLSYWTDGDTRRRGEVLARIKARYRGSGWLVDTHGELVDYLPMVLEYAALADPQDGPALLQEYRASLELLRLALLEVDPAYGRVVSAVCATLPGESPKDRAAVHAMAAAGPPREQVGLDAYDPRLLALAEANRTGGNL
jgi:nitrate reductase delta subunit